MTKKQSFGSWLGISEEVGWCSGIQGDPTGMHLFTDWEIRTPGYTKEIIWGHDRDAPAMTNLGMKNPSEINLVSRNFWNARPLYLLAGGGSYNGSTGYIEFTSGAMKSCALHGYNNGTHKTYSGCVIEEFVLNIPKAGNLNFNLKAIAADWTKETATKPSGITESLRSDHGTYTFKKNGVAISDVFMGGSVAFRNNANTDTLDISNRRIAKPSFGNLELIINGEFRLDDEDNFLEAYESGETGVFDIDMVIKDADNTGIVLDLDNFQIQEFTEPVPNAQEGIVTQTITFVQSEDSIINKIQVTGVDFT